MRAVDSGVLACAVNRFAPEHTRAARALEELAAGDTPWGLPWPAVHEFLGLVTHPHRVARPLALSDAFGFVAELLKSPTVRPLGATERHAEVLAEVIATPGTAGHDPTRLELAAVLREHGVRELLSADRGMRRFGFLEVRDPLHGPPWSPGEPPGRRYRRLRPA